jgi:hypothetical protein
MTEVPKIVHHRLRTAMPAAELLEQMHPEADVLTAFAEQALSAPEREGVLQHLALCGDCRDVVALALPATDLLASDAIVRPQEVGEEVGVVTVLAGTGAVTRSGNREGKSKSRIAWAGFGWGQMRWATLAAGIAVAVFVVRPALEHIGKPHPQVNSAANEISPAAQPTTALQTASEAVPVNPAVATKNAVTGAASGTPMDSKIASNKVKINSVEPMTGANMTSANMRGADTSLANTIGGLDGRSVSSPQPQPPQMTASRSEQSGMQLVGTLGATGGSVKQNADRLKADRVKKDAVSAGLAGVPRRELGTPGAERKSEAEKTALGKSVVASSSTMVEVTAAASTEVETTTESGSTLVSTEANLMAQADQPPRERAMLQDAPAIIRAKPALDDSATRDAAVTAANESGKTSAGKTSTTTEVASLEAGVTPKAKTRNFAVQAAAPLAMQKQSANWTIADGVLQRSLDGGHTWQMAARAEHALLCYANRGQEVWAGGQAGTLLHSVDNGATWSAVAVSVGGQRLSSDVTRVDVRGPTEIVLSTDAHETFSSTDDGKTWEKK